MLSRRRSPELVDAVIMLTLVILLGFMLAIGVRDLRAGRVRPSIFAISVTDMPQ
jgi:hypothetical protein